MIGMKVATTVRPPPTPSARASRSQVRRAQIRQQLAEAVDEQRRGDAVEEVDEGAAEIDGEDEHQVHHRQEERDAPASG
jgi:hypothetical protein